LKLFIAEKPSLAQAISSALGSVQKDDGYYREQVENARLNY